MATIPEVATAMRAVLTAAADGAARATGFVRRRSKLTGAGFAQTLVFGWLGDPDATLAGLSQTAAALGVRISPQGLDQRFTPAAAACLGRTLEAAVGTVVAADPVAVPLLARFSGVYVQDSTVVGLPAALAGAWPGCGNGDGPGAAVKLQARLDLRGGGLSGPLPHAGRDHDRAAPRHPPLPAGALRLADLGYYSLEEFRALGAAGAYWLSRLQVQAAVFDAAGRRREVLALLAATGAPAVDLPVRLGVDERLPARLLAVRVPPEVAAERRRKLRAEARRRGQMVSARRLAWADWTILVTNVPPELLTLPEALVLARARWQIELLFKLWKSHGRIDAWRSAKPDRILCELYAKLLAMVLQHWLLLVSCWRYPDRSLTKAARTVRALALHLAAASHAPARLRAAIATLQRCLAAGARINKRRAAPHTYQLLPAIADDGPPATIEGDRAA
jgi:hypothetical protein